MTRMFVAILAAFFVVGATGMIGQVQAGGSTAPLGYQLMCLKTPQECRGGGASVITATASVMATLKRVNASVNRSITPQSDTGADVWNADATVGDCEEYVLAKRRQLIRAGLPASALRIAYVKTRRGEGHAVLIVRTNRGDLVLDNLTSAIRPLSQTGLRLVSMSGADGQSWS